MSFIPPKKGVSYTFYCSLVSQADTKVFQANPTLATGDVKVAVDDAAPANITTLPVVDADFTKRIKVTLSTSEMNGDNITIIFSDVAGAEWCDLTIDIATALQQVDDLATQASVDALPDAAGINAEVVDALNVDTYAEPGQGTPAATASIAAKVNYLFKAWRNKHTQSATIYSLFADDGTTVDQKATVSDTGGVTTIGEVASGP